MESVIQDIQTTRYAQLSSCTLVIFDHLITLDDEVSLIWNSTWSPGKILFLINRYYNLCAVIFNIYALFLATKTNELYVQPTKILVNLLSDWFLNMNHSCLRLFQWQGWTGLIAFMIAEAILQLRIYALYSLNKKLLTVMLIFYVACSGCSAWIVITELSSITITAPILTTDVSFCLPLFLPRGIFRYWIPMLSFECLLCVLVLFQGFRRFRSDSSIFRSGKRLVSALIRDSIVYFLVIFATYLTCLLVWAFARQTFIEVPVGFSVTMSCILANRVVMNCRKISRSVTCNITPGMKISRTGRNMIVVDDDDDEDVGNIITKDLNGKKEEVFSVSKEESGGGCRVGHTGFRKTAIDYL